ncbi:YunC family protein [Paraglaciecola aquimarina]|uniref:YunC family protein n=1 Tax=Paraglaciecola algarum TaxID=3050085 RepID=A0ABS9D6R5_9ALTE|nr:YunC family protein [Paraglaciecola sp. G1-23]MCF2948633.1 YunC family protein [Paraglaciecola sp. G1-23]
MKKIVAVMLGFLTVTNIHAESFDWGELEKARIDLKLPLLTIQGEKGILACGYVNVTTCDKTDEACAIVSGVNNHDEMLAKPVVAVSKQAEKLGVKLGMSGKEALSILR